MKKGKSRIERLINAVSAFDPSTLPKRWSSEQTVLETKIDGELQSVFGPDTVEYFRYQPATRLDQGPVVRAVVAGYGSHRAERDVVADARRYVAEGKVQSVQLLQQAVDWLEQEMADVEPETAAGDKGVKASPLPRKIFIVHGHDEGAKATVARFIDSIELEAIILSEQANQGRTIMEKIEAHGDVNFAVVLLTPDDMGGKSGQPVRPRARQNVLLELGYFIGRLGRANVCALADTSGDMELPTDFAGVVWEELDSHGAWKQALARELDAAGFRIDWNKVMRKH